MMRRLCGPLALLLALTLPALAGTAPPPALKPLSPQAYQQEVAQADYEHHTVGIARFAELMRDPKAVILDLRAAQQYESAHLRNAKQLGADIDEKKLASLIPSKDTPVLLYCSNSLMLSRMMSLTDVALPQLLVLGYKNVYLLKDAARDREPDAFSGDRMKWLNEQAAAPEKNIQHGARKE